MRWGRVEDASSYVLMMKVVEIGGIALRFNFIEFQCVNPSNSIVEFCGSNPTLELALCRKILFLKNPQHFDSTQLRKFSHLRLQPTVKMK